MWENTDQKNSKYKHFLRSEYFVNQFCVFWRTNNWASSSNSSCWPFSASWVIFFIIDFYHGLEWCRKILPMSVNNVNEAEHLFHTSKGCTKQWGRWRRFKPKCSIKMLKVAEAGACWIVFLDFHGIFASTQSPDTIISSVCLSMRVLVVGTDELF